MNDKPWEVIQGDVRAVLKKLPPNYFDAVISDPPYGLSFMGKRWDYELPSVNVWTELLRVVKPGANVMLFGGSRTFHRLAVSVEDAGFELRDTLMWLYGCLSDDTEILVDGRWEPYYRATSGRLALCYDMNREEYSWQPINQLFVYPYNDTAYRIRSDSTDQIVSRNHRCIVERGGAYAFELAEDIAREREARVPVLEGLWDLLCALSVSDEGASDEECYVQQGVLGDCDRSAGNGSSLSAESQGAPTLHGVSQSFQALSISCCASGRSELFLRMCRIASRSGMGETCAQGEGCVDGCIPSSVEGAYDWCNESDVEGWRHDLQDARQLCGGSIREMSSCVYLDGAQGRLRYGASPIRGDGHWAFAIAHGDGASRGPRSKEQRADESGTVRKQPRPQAVRASRFTRSDLARVEPFHLNGIVWCVSVPTGAFVARRNGKVFVTGNSGFPKSHDVAKALDKTAGHWRGRAGGVVSTNGAMGGPNYKRTLKGGPITAAAAAWDGYGTALKPAFEPIILARKMLEGTVAENVTKWGVGGLDIDGGRIGEEARLNGSASPKGMWKSFAGNEDGRPAVGRWPANVLLDEEAGVMLDEQSGERPSTPYRENVARGSVLPLAKRTEGGYSDNGGASRFFYTTKASRSERELGTKTLKKVAQGADALRDGNRSDGEVGNNHPTVKPIDLIRYMARLVLPPKRGTLRRVLVPFGGSGSEMIGCLQAGWEEVTGIERELDYIQIAEARIRNGGVFSRLEREKTRSTSSLRANKPHAKTSR